jgi:tRNA(fMet)-specific endonuclease VapC
VFALDTNTLIYYFKGAGRVQDHLLATSPTEIAVPSVVVYELEVGIAQSTRPTARRALLDEFLAVVTILPLDEAAAKIAAETAGILSAKGTPIGPMDTLIAGTALAYQATLITHNLREFRRVPGLSLVDWF